MSHRTFTLSEANALLAELQVELMRLQSLARQLEEGQDELQRLKAMRESSAAAAGERDPFFEKEGQLDFLRMEADLCIRNFTRQGVLLKRIEPALLDFPAVLEGEDVLLCWEEGEESITHYHGWHDGFMGRRPVPGP